MGRRHCWSQHLLWQRNHHGWDQMIKHHLILQWMIRFLLFNLAGAFPAKRILVEMERRIRMGPIEFISSLGGLFGLCLGFSFISFFEIVYWAIKALSRSFIQHFYSIDTLSSRNNWTKRREVWDMLPESTRIFVWVQRNRIILGWILAPDETII